MGEKWNFEGGVKGWSLKEGIMIQPPASYITLTSPKFMVVVQVPSLF